MDYKPTKTKKPQESNPNTVSERDCFLTPRYATNLLVPYLRNAPHQINRVWECAAGSHNMIVNHLQDSGFNVHSSDLQFNSSIHSQHLNFLTELPDVDFDVVVTNPPFSLKKKFYERCLFLGKPFALLIPADYSGWVIDALRNGCERITPTRRIDYVTPNTLKRINDLNMMLTAIEGEGIKYKKPSDVPDEVQRLYRDQSIQYEKLSDIPDKRLSEATSSDFHSYWLTKGLEIGSMEVFADLPKSEKTNIW